MGTDSLIESVLQKTNNRFSQISLAQPSRAQPSEAQHSEAKRSEAQPSKAQHSEAQRSPAKNGGRLFKPGPVLQKNNKAISPNFPAKQSRAQLS
jgi:hypothetical protein